MCLSPFYRSPQVDGGYDVADFRAVDPMFGTPNDFDQRLAAAHAVGLRVIVDILPNASGIQLPVSASPVGRDRLARGH